MVDGAAYLASPLFSAYQSGFWSNQRGTNLLDSGAPFYDVYECKCGDFLATGAIEPQFYKQLLMVLGLIPMRFHLRMTGNIGERQKTSLQRGS